MRNAFAPFGNNIYYSYQLFLTPTNLIALAPNVTVSPIESLRLTFEHQFAWRASLTDAVYRANGTAFSGTQKTHARRVAQSTVCRASGRGRQGWASPRDTSICKQALL